MIRKQQFIWILLIAFLLPSCEFKCQVEQVRNKKTAKDEMPVVKGGTAIYNGIELTANKIKVKKAYLLFADGERVPANNMIDFTQPVKLVIEFDSGWVENDNKVKLGASEKVVKDNGDTVLDEEDLFAKSNVESVSADDAKLIFLSVTLTPKGSSGPGYYTVLFKIWDKQGDGYVEGAYRLYSK